MSCILYYSNKCDHSQKYLQILGKCNLEKEVHFICIDSRIKEANGKTYIILQNQQRIVLPDNVTRVPALLLINEGYRVLYGESILQYLKPIQQNKIVRATQNNLEPMAFSDTGGFSNNGIYSDHYSSVNLDANQLSFQNGDAGMHQMYNYTSYSSTENDGTYGVNYDNNSSTTKGSNRMDADASKSKIDAFLAERAVDLNRIPNNRPPPPIDNR
jgi:hypothetical protein